MGELDNSPHLRGHHARSASPVAQHGRLSAMEKPISEARLGTLLAGSGAPRKVVGGMEGWLPGVRSPGRRVRNCRVLLSWLLLGWSLLSWGSLLRGRP